MSDIQMEFVPWDAGTTVTAYQRKSELMLDTMPPPMIPAAGTATVQADRSLSFTGLDPGTYWATAMIADRCQYVAFNIEPGAAAAQMIGPPGPPGPAIDVITFEYSFNTTTASPPGTGQARLDSADQTTATHLYLADTDAPGVDQSRELLTGVRVWRIDLQDKDDATRYAQYRVTTRTDAGGYVDFAVSFAEGGAALVAQRVLVTVLREFAT